jgi:hypothetical protein
MIQFLIYKRLGFHPKECQRLIQIDRPQKIAIPCYEIFISLGYCQYGAQRAHFVQSGRNCTKIEGGPLGAGLQEQALKHRILANIAFMLRKYI